MAFVTDVRESQTLLDACSSTQEWQMLMDSVLIPDEWMAMAYARLTELTVQEIEVSFIIIGLLASFTPYNIVSLL